MKLIGRILLILIFITSLTVGIVAFVLISSAYKSLPDVSTLVETYTPEIPTTIYDINGEIVDKVYRENREIANITAVPDYVKYAFVAIEDRKFYSHHGFDVLRLFKGTIFRLVTLRRMHGGSTITQQLAKNAFLTQERKVTRKVKEALISLEIEKKYTKDEILQKYINEINFGSGAYGIKTAANYFFDKDISKVNLAQAALLAGIPNRPAAYNPFRHLDNSIRRQKLVLRQMKKYGFITDKEYKDALNFKIETSKPKKRNYNAPSFTNIVTKKVFDKYGEQLVYEGGLKIYTTVDLRMQKIAEESFNNGKYLKERKDLNGALITIDSNSGYVKAVVGGKNFKSGNFNRATMSIRQPGSSFKPFLYYTVLRFGYQMNQIVEDNKIKLGSWEPQNYGETFRGNMTILEGMEDSVNMVAIKLLKKVVIKNLIATARMAGITSDIPYNLTIALGSIGVSPFELASAYLPFSNGGYKVKPIFITKIEDRYGKTMFENKIEKEKVFDSDKISLLVHMMKNVVKKGSGKSANIGIEQAGKTGTTNNFSNAWFSGYTPDFVTTIYVGYDNNKSMGRGMTGGRVSGSIWATYVKKIIKEGIYKPTKFEFLEDNIKNKKLVYKQIDLDTGLLKDKSSRGYRTALFKRGTSPVENSKKYKFGLENLLPKEEIEVDENQNITNDPIKNILNSIFN